MPEHVPATDRSHGGPGSSHEDKEGQSGRTTRGERTGEAHEKGDGRQKGTAHGSHGHADETDKANHKSENGGKP